MSSDGKSTWRKKARHFLASAFGNKCCICGYDKCQSAMDYHHLDRNSKDGALSVAMRNGGAWSKIVNEAKKCIMVCCRCHREIHAGIIEIPKDVKRFDESYSDVIKMREKEYDSCPVCGKTKPKCQKYCSIKCSCKMQMKADITKEELQVDIENMPVTKIANKHGVSDAAIIKRCKKFGIKTKGRGYWTKIYRENNMSL